MGQLLVFTSYLILETLILGNLLGGVRVNTLLTLDWALSSSMMKSSENDSLHHLLKGNHTCSDGFSVHSIHILARMVGVQGVLLKVEAAASEHLCRMLNRAHFLKFLTMLATLLPAIAGHYFGYLKTRLVALIVLATSAASLLTVMNNQLLTTSTAHRTLHDDWSSCWSLFSISIVGLGVSGWTLWLTALFGLSSTPQKHLHTLLFLICGAFETGPLLSFSVLAISKSPTQSLTTACSLLILGSLISFLVSLLAHRKMLFRENRPAWVETSPKHTQSGKPPIRLYAVDEVFWSHLFLLGLFRTFLQFQRRNPITEDETLLRLRQIFLLPNESLHHQTSEVFNYASLVTGTLFGVIFDHQVQTSSDSIYQRMICCQTPVISLHICCLALASLASMLALVPNSLFINLLALVNSLLRAMISVYVVRLFSLRYPMQHFLLMMGIFTSLLSLFDNLVWPLEWVTVHCLEHSPFFINFAFCLLHAFSFFHPLLLWHDSGGGVPPSSSGNSTVIHTKTHKLRKFNMGGVKGVTAAGIFPCEAAGLTPMLRVVRTAIGVFVNPKDVNTSAV